MGCASTHQEKSSCKKDYFHIIFLSISDKGVNRELLGGDKGESAIFELNSAYSKIKGPHNLNPTLGQVLRSYAVPQSLSRVAIEPVTCALVIGLAIGALTGGTVGYNLGWLKRHIDATFTYKPSQSSDCNNKVGQLLRNTESQHAELPDETVMTTN